MFSIASQEKNASTPASTTIVTGRFLKLPTHAERELNTSYTSASAGNIYAPMNV